VGRERMLAVVRLREAREERGHMDTTDAFLKVVHAMEYCDNESKKRAYKGYSSGHLSTHHWHRQGYYELKRVLQKQWRVPLGVGLDYEWLAIDERVEFDYKKLLFGTWDVNTTTATGVDWDWGYGGVTLDTVFSWKEKLGENALHWFGKRGAHCSAATYEEMKRRCQRLVNASLWSTFGGLSVHVIDRWDVPDGVLRACDCDAAKV
jgi:hypothetical protein